MKKVCRTCGYEVDEGMNFCPNCGQKFSNKESKEIHQAMNEIYQEYDEEVEVKPKSKTGLIIVLALLVVLLLGAIGFLGFKLLKQDEPSVDPGIVDEIDPTPDNPTDETDTENDPVVDDTTDTEQDVATDTDEGHIEGLNVNEIEFVTDNSEDIYRVIVYFEYTGDEENLRVTLLDPSNVLQVGPIALPDGADHVYFLLGKATLLMVNQMDFIFETDQSEITYTVYKSDYEQHLQR